ncbi:MAG: hypothetical protein U1F54_00105 [Burkholderiales bacterium]
MAAVIAHAIRELETPSIKTLKVSYRMVWPRTASGREREMQ